MLEIIYYIIGIYVGLSIIALECLALYAMSQRRKLSKNNTTNKGLKN